MSNSDAWYENDTRQVNAPEHRVPFKEKVCWTAISLFVFLVPWLWAFGSLQMTGSPWDRKPYPMHESLQECLNMFWNWASDPLPSKPDEERWMKIALSYFGLPAYSQLNQFNHKSTGGISPFEVCCQIPVYGIVTSKSLALISPCWWVKKRVGCWGEWAHVQFQSQFNKSFIWSHLTSL